MITDKKERRWTLPFGDLLVIPAKQVVDLRELE